MNEEMKKLFTEFLKEHIAVEVETDTEWEGEYQYASITVKLCVDNEVISENYGSINITP